MESNICLADVVFKTPKRSSDLNDLMSINYVGNNKNYIHISVRHVKYMIGI